MSQLLLSSTFDEEPVDYDAILGGDARAPLTKTPDDIDLIGTAVSNADAGKKTEWMLQLDLNDQAGIKPTLHNIELIVRNDTRLIGLPQHNEFTLEPVQRRNPGTTRRRAKPGKQMRQLNGPVWEVKDRVNGDLWSDDRDFSIRSILEAPNQQGGYGIKISDRDLKAAIVLASRDNSFHPVREYFTGLEWDGRPRVEGLFTDYVGAPGDAYTRAVSRLMMIGAVCRIFEPGHKADHVAILEGLQGVRKSTFIRILAKSWFAELNDCWDDPKLAVETMQGAFILELPELSGFGRADVRSIKAFISRQTDKTRLAYARRAIEFARQCTFIGSTNDHAYLADESGGRRWWPIKCRAPAIDTGRLEREVDQLWAEALALYRAMRVAQPQGTLPLYLTDAEASGEALRLQESRRGESADDVLAGQIGAWLDRPLTTGSIDDDNSTRVRNETCAAEIWTDCLGKELGSMQQRDSLMIGRAMKSVGGWENAGQTAPHGRFGRQRIWERGGLEGRLERTPNAS